MQAAMVRHILNRNGVPHGSQPGTGDTSSWNLPADRAGLLRQSGQTLSCPRKAVNCLDNPLVFAENVATALTGRSCWKCRCSWIGSSDSLSTPVLTMQIGEGVRVLVHPRCEAGRSLVGTAGRMGGFQST